MDIANDEEPTIFPIEIEPKPFYTVYFKCDDQFNPKPPALIQLIVNKLIKRNLPHMVVQNSHKPPIDVLLKMTAYIYYTLDGKLIQVVRADKWLEEDNRTLLLIENYENGIPPMESDLFYPDMYWSY